MQQRDDLTDRSRDRDRLDLENGKLDKAGLASPKGVKPLISYGGDSFRSQPRLPLLRRLALLLSRTRLGLQLLTVAACLAWMTASSWAILVNKHIMVALHFPYPCTIAWMGLATTTLASAAAIRLAAAASRAGWSLASSAAAAPSSVHGGAGAAGGALAGLGSPSSSSSSTLLASGRVVTVTMTPRYYLTRVLPTGGFMALTFQTGNMGYLYLTVAFVQMLKAFCPVVTMLLLFATRLEAASGRLVAAVGLIAVGVALASYGELNMSLFGLAAMLVSVVAESVRLVMTQQLLVAGGAGLHPLEGLFYISSACTAVLAVQASYLEWPQLLRQRHYLAVHAHPYSFAAAACCGFLVNMLAILVIRLASSLTLKVLGTVKDAALVTIGIVFLHETVTPLQLVGYTISMVGFVSYNLIKAAQQQHHQGGLLLGGGGGGGSTVGGSGRGSVRSLLPYYDITVSAASNKTR